MYGFIEARLATLLNIPFDMFLLNNGGQAAIISREHYDKVLRLLNRYCAEVNNDTLPINTQSDIVGMHVILSKYYYNDDVLDGLTNGHTKETVEYIRIKQQGISIDRFDVEHFERLMQQFNNELLDMPTLNGDANDDTVVRRVDRVTTTTAAPIVTTQENDQEINVCNTDNTSEILEELRQYCSLISVIGTNFFIARLMSSGYMDTTHEILSNFSKQINKHIIIGDDKRFIDRLYAKFDIKKNNNFLIISINPHTYNNQFIMSTNTFKSVLLGHEVTDLYVVSGEANKELNTIQDSILSLEYKKKRCNEILRSGRNSIYAQYDKIYKDVVTNVVFAVQDRNCIFITINCCDNYSYVNDAILTEIQRRFDGSLSYDELFKIDSEYQKELSQRTCDSYVQFVLNTSTSILTQLKKKYEEAKNDYEEFFAKAMESGKLCSKYMEQIDSFNESEQQVKIKTKAFEEYLAVKQIDKVKAIYIKNDIINVYTDNLYAVDDRTKKLHDIGTFHITIGMHSNSYDTASTVVIKNTKHQIKGFSGEIMQAPHVFNNGNICHGSLASGMMTAYKKRDLYQLILQLILFLQNANTDDAAGKYINNWPEVNEDIVKEKISTPNCYFVNNEEDLKFNDAFAASIPV